MQTLAEVCGAAVAFTYRSIDRLILNAYIPTLQTPVAMAYFLREVCDWPILSGHAFKWLTDRFVAQVERFAQATTCPSCGPKGTRDRAKWRSGRSRPRPAPTAGASWPSWSIRRWPASSPATMPAAGPPTSA